MSLSISSNESNIFTENEKNSLIQNNNGLKKIFEEYDININNIPKDNSSVISLSKSDKSFDTNIFKKRDLSFDIFPVNPNHKNLFKNITPLFIFVRFDDGYKYFELLDKIFFDKLKFWRGLIFNGTILSKWRFLKKYLSQSDIIFTVDFESLNKVFETYLNEIIKLKIELEDNVRFFYIIKKIIKNLKHLISLLKIKKWPFKKEIISIKNMEKISISSGKNVFEKKEKIIEYIKRVFPSFQKCINISIKSFIVTNDYCKIFDILENEILRKFFIRRIRDYLKYIKINKNGLFLKFEQDEKDKIFLDEFLKNKMPPFNFIYLNEKKYFQSHSLNFLNFILSKKIIIIICRELAKECDDFLKKIFKFKKYPYHYNKMKDALYLI